MTDAAPETSYYSARPILHVDGILEASLGESDVQALVVEETTLGLFRCEANFINWGPGHGGAGFMFFDRQLLDFGKAFSVQFGPPGLSGPVFAGRITGIEAHYPPDRPPEIQILAEDRFQDLRMERRTRSFEDVSDADVIRQLATEHGLTAEVDVDGPTYPTLVQFNQSDLAFIRERMAAIDAELWVDNRTLYAQSRSRRNADTVQCTYGQELLEFSVLADLAHQRSATTVSGWDVNAKEATEAVAEESAISAELVGTSGSQILGQALGERQERLVLAMPLSQSEAQHVADARYRARARSFVRGTGLVDGNVKIRVGAALDLRGLGDLFDGVYYVILARHTFSEVDGYRTAFEVERPWIGP